MSLKYYQELFELHFADLDLLMDLSLFGFGIFDGLCEYVFHESNDFEIHLCLCIGRHINYSIVDQNAYAHPYEFQTLSENKKLVFEQKEDFRDGLEFKNQLEISSD